METPTPRRYRLRWIALASAVVIACLAYVAVPWLVWLRRSVQQANAATEVSSTVIGEPAADWHTTDIYGTPCALTDYRGKVVVLDFWYAGCGWCIRAMPQVVALARDFQDQPVVVLGVNTDTGAEEDRRQRVIDSLQVSYPTLIDEHDGARISELYKVTLWPTLVVLDQRGVVRHVHCGYWPSLRGELASKIRELIDE